MSCILLWFVPRWPEILKALHLSWKYLEWMILHRSWAVTDNELQIVVVVRLVWVIQALIVYILHNLFVVYFTCCCPGVSTMDRKDWRPYCFHFLWGSWLAHAEQGQYAILAQFFWSGCVCLCLSEILGIQAVYCGSINRFVLLTVIELSYSN